MGVPSPSIEKIMEVGMGFWASKTLLSAVELGVFTTLAKGAMTGAELAQALGLHERATPDFFDALLALGFLERDSDGEAARYRNTEDTAFFLDRNRPTYAGGFLEMANEANPVIPTHVPPGEERPRASGGSEARVTPSGASLPWRLSGPWGSRIGGRSDRFHTRA